MIGGVGTNSQGTDASWQASRADKNHRRRRGKLDGNSIADFCETVCLDVKRGLYFVSAAGRRLGELVISVFPAVAGMSARYPRSITAKTLK